MYISFVQWMKHLQNLLRIEVPGRQSSLAVDGVLDTGYYARACSHAGAAPAVWSVDLSATADICYADVLNRGQGGSKIYLNNTYSESWLKLGYALVVVL